MQMLTRIFGLMRVFSSIVHALCDFFWHHLGYQAVCLGAKFVEHCIMWSCLGMLEKKNFTMLIFF